METGFSAKSKPEAMLPEKHPNLPPNEFLADWEKQFDNPEYSLGHFTYQAPKTSPNAQFSSKGWKLHVQFGKGSEKVFASLLNTYGQYFKIEGEVGTYFNGKTHSGATIYVGSRENLEKLIELINQRCPQLPSAGQPTRTVSGKEIYAGSGTDEPISFGLAARFDVQKSEFKDKYSGYGFAAWLEFRGLPVMEEDVAHVNYLEKIIKRKGEGQEEKKRAYAELKEIFAKTEKEVLRDFGEEFVYGKKGS